MPSTSARDRFRTAPLRPWLDARGRADDRRQWLPVAVRPACLPRGEWAATMRMIRTIFFGLRDVGRDERVRGLLFFAFSMIALATVTFWLAEDWSLLDAAFFSVVTISTVGYGNLVPETVIGKLFAMFYILIGLGVFVAAASAVAEALLRRREDDHDKQS